MKKTLQTLIQSAKQLLHFDTYTRIKKGRFLIHTIIFWILIITTYIQSLQQDLVAVLLGIMTISYIPFITIELYHRPQHRQRYRYGGLIITACWTLSGIVNINYTINALWSAGFLTIGRWVRDYCTVVRRWKTRNVYNQVSTIGIFLISIVFAIITMRRFQSIDFSCNNINFLSTKFVNQFNSSDSVRASTVTQVVVSGSRSGYLQLLDQRLKTDESRSLSNTIKQQVRNSVIVVMDQKKLYDKSICDYVTTALNDNYQKPSFFYSGVLLLTFIGLPAARIALIVIASIFSLILRGLHHAGIYRSHTTLIEHEVLE